MNLIEGEKSLGKSMSSNTSDSKGDRIKRNTFSAFVLACIISAMIVNDLPIQSSLGTLGASPIWIFSALFFFIIWVSNRFYLYPDKYSKLFLVYFIICSCISFIQCIWYYLSTGTVLNTFSVSVLNKSIFASSYYLVYFFTIYTVNFLSKFITKEFLIKLINFISTILIVIVCVEYINPNILSGFHLSMDGYDVGTRLRLLSPEPSIAAFTFNMFLLTAIAFSRVKAFVIVLWIAMLGGNFLIGSKSALLLIMCGGILVFYFNMTFVQKIKYLILLIPIVIIIGFFAYYFVLPALIADIDNFTSVSTRLITSLWAICSLFYYPLGEGFGTYTVYFSLPLTNAINIAESVMPFSLNLSEINAMINTGEYLTAKSGILFSIIHSGIFTIAFYYLLFKYAFYDINTSNATYYQKVILRIILWYTLLSILLAVNIEILYAFLLPFAVINFIKSNSITVIKND